LCPKYCHLQEGVSHCSHYSIKTCNGICKDDESTSVYNQRVLKAIENLNTTESKVIKEKGRTKDEDAFILIKDGTYLGYGFIDKSETINSEDDLENFLIRQKDNLDVQKILRMPSIA
ncbi:MAG: DNA polymerase III subunit epsilon, partial [Algicola sp.]|nr:DNA polymerase III subunit epsilon [Algicola sp.]